MRAVLCKEFGPPESLVIEDLPSPKAGEGEVVVSVKACGVNFPDILIIQGKYQFKPPMPFSPGAEASGIIKEVGEGVQNYKVGDKVLLFSAAGMFLQEIAVNASTLVPYPEGLDFASAAGFYMTYGTSYYALKDRAELQPGETLLVLGAAGGVGLAAVELGKALGAKVIAAAGSDEKLEICKQYGADLTINYAKEDLKDAIKSLTGGNGVDVIYDPVGSHYAEPALRGMAWGGRYLVIGFAAGDIPKIPLNLTLLKSCSIVGVFWGAFRQREPKRERALLLEMYDMLKEGKLKPHVSATYPLEKVADALNDISNRKIIGKAVLLP
jgi:NADPH:quinone reductase